MQGPRPVAKLASERRIRHLKTPRPDASMPARLEELLPRSIAMTMTTTTMSIGPFLSRKTTILTDRSESGGPSHNHTRFMSLNYFPDRHRGNNLPHGSLQDSQANRNRPYMLKIC